MLRSTPWPLNSSGLLWPAQVQVMVTGRPRHAHGRIVYLQYLQHLAGQIPPRTQEEHYESPYLDFLQAPLQPLMDNLESQTYETFEKDPIKYNQYRKATALALLDQIRQRHPGAPIPQVPASTFDHDAEGKAPLVQQALAQAPGAGSGSGEAAGEAVLCKLLLMVVGAGRGPLVRASLKAAEEVRPAHTHTPSTCPSYLTPHPGSPRRPPASFDFRR